MVIVKISSPGISIMALEVNSDELLSNFLVVDGQSSAREYLLNILRTGYLEGRPEWNSTQIMKALTIEIPSLNVEYILQEDENERQQGQEEPQNEVQNKKTVTKWTHRSVLRLIYHWSQRRNRFENNIDKNESVWEDLAEAMVAEGIPISSTQCENKFKYIKRVYMETKDYNRKSTGQPEKTCAFFEELDDLFKKSAQASPPTLASSRDGAPSPSQSSPSAQISVPGSIDSLESTSTDTIPEEEGIGHTPRKRSRLESSLTKWSEEFQQKTTEREMARQKRHEELIQLQRETNDLYKMMMTKLLEKI